MKKRRGHKTPKKPKKNKNQTQPKTKKTSEEIAKKNIEDAFFEAKKLGLTVKKDKYRNNTYEDYEKSMKTMIGDLARIHGADSDKLRPTHMNGKLWDHYFETLADRYDARDLSAGQIQRRVNALEAFRTFINNTNVIGENVNIRVGNHKELLDYLKSRGVLRSTDEISALKPSQLQVSDVIASINDKTERGKTITKVSNLQEQTGGRIKSIYKLQVKDVDFENKTIKFRNDKNNFNRTVPMYDGAYKLLKEATNGKKPSAPVFSIKGRDGKDLRIEAAVKVTQTYVKNAAINSLNYSEKARFTTHSFRKRYAQNLYDSTYNLTKNQVRKLIADYVNLQGSNKEKLIERMKRENERVNRHRTKKGMTKNGFNREQLRRMLVSLHLGHSRIDVVAKSYIIADNKKGK